MSRKSIITNTSNQSHQSLKLIEIYINISKNTNLIKSPKIAIKPPLKLVPSLVGATAGPSNSTGEGAGETLKNLRLPDNTTVTNFRPFSQLPCVPLIK